ncbi:subtilase family protein [Aliiruegeria haliotis]|uniref:Subtilase family protein n=1 Tax=Aliiruegeria haliotis TaxID=1280846 RepID=A0A2T0RY89_9RHOB|nr:S8 family serine peptidase [Aliiruegeria haliotis]PRY26127.1 subtilase family protein [Aliiruegeria haliotis]
MAQVEYDALDKGSVPTGTDPLSIELVYEAPLPQSTVEARLRAALPGAVATVAAAFTPEGDRYHFVDFPDIAPKGQEREIFDFARSLRSAMEAQEANAVLPDSLYGADHVGAVGDRESLFSLCETPRDNSLAFGWHHPRINTPAAWTHGQGAGAVVAVIDTGYSDHNELSGVITTQGEVNLVEGGNDARDRFSTGFMKHPGHGTLVCSVIASRGTVNGAGHTGGPGAVTGTAPAAKVMPIRAIKSVVDATQRRIHTAIVHAANNGADVISMALGGPTRVASTEAALRAAVRAGCVITCAAGNCWPRVVFPAAYAQFGICTAVAALRPDLRPWAKTGRGPEVTFSAYGEQVWGAAKNRASDPGNGIRASQGTTLATSMTAGVAALWVARHGGRGALLAEARARNTTVQAMWVHCATAAMTPPSAWGGSTSLGAGVLDAEAALDASLPPATEGVGDPADSTEPTLNILQAHLAGVDEAAVNELDPGMADYAQEMLWMSYRSGARARALEGLAEEAILPGDAPSDGLAGRLSGKPALRAALGL